MFQTVLIKLSYHKRGVPEVGFRLAHTNKHPTTGPLGPNNPRKDTGLIPGLAGVRRKIEVGSQDR